jgi:hypothetical protein
VDRRGELQARLDAQALDLSALPSGAVKEALLTLQADLAGAAEERRDVLAAALQLGWEKVHEATCA